MMHLQPQGLDRQRVEELLSKAEDEHSVSRRIEFFSRQFLGCPYKANPLIGSAETPEVFTVSLDGFDCVTYIETTLALALASTVDGFVKWLRTIRYEQGLIEWERRNHYMTGWIRNNVREGIIRPLPASQILQVSKERILNVVSGLSPQWTHIRCVPKAAAPRLMPHLQSGDLVSFVSIRKSLDVFHAGIIMCEDKDVLMRHASRGQGCVAEQKLGEFLKANRMTGVIVVRPQEVSRNSAPGK